MTNPSTTKASERTQKLTAEQRENIRFAIRWADGYKLCGVKHVKGEAWNK